jgi:hypothetical protein
MPLRQVFIAILMLLFCFKIRPTPVQLTMSDATQTYSIISVGFLVNQYIKVSSGDHQPFFDPENLHR